MNPHARRHGFLRAACLPIPPPSQGDYTLSKQRKWTDQELIDAVNNSYSIPQVMHALNLAIAGGTHSNIKKHIQRLNLDTSHFKGQGWNRGNRKFSIEKILVENSEYYSGSQFKKRILEEGLLKNKCYICNLPPRWNEQELVLQLDHINGIRTDNRLENLRMLCPNCHSQTHTYGGRNK